MRSLRTALGAALLALVAGLPPAAGPAAAQGVPPDWPDPAELTPDPIEFTAPEPRRERLSNGIRVYLLEDRTLPLVQGVAYVEAPSVYDPEGLTGLAQTTAALLREGGTASVPPEQLDASLEALAAVIEASASEVLASVSFNALTDTLDEVLPLWRDVLTEPRFDDERLEVLRRRQIEAVRRVVDDPVGLAFREFLHAVSGGHPAGAYPTEETLAAITRADVVRFHEQHYGPANTVVAVTGDFVADEMLALLERHLGGWERETAPPPELPPYPQPEPAIYLLPRPITQSVIMLGHPTARAYTPTYDDLDVANQILGAGGFSSRLFTEIRTRRGLAYSTGSTITQGFDWPGVFVTYSISPAQTTAQVLGLLRAEIERLQADGVTSEELDDARDTILNASLFRYASPAAVNERTARVELLGLESDYYERYLENVQTITTSEVQQVAREELHPDRAVVLVVGDPEQFDRPLEELGEVVTIELD